MVINNICKNSILIRSICVYQIGNLIKLYITIYYSIIDHKI